MAQAEFRGVPVHHAEPVGQPREPPHVHLPRLVLTLDKGRGDGVGLGLPSTGILRVPMHSAGL
jgi:hypothetical protein